MVSLTEHFKCRMEEADIESMIFGRTTVVDGKILLLVFNFIHFRCSGGSRCQESKVNGIPMG